MSTFPVTDSAKRCLSRLFSEKREILIDAATDWVIAGARDLKGIRPREETRKLTSKLAESMEALLLRDSQIPLLDFVEFVTGYRANSEFYISTLLRGFGSIRAASIDLISPPFEDGETAFRTLLALDEAYLTAICLMGDKYVEKLNATILHRRQELEKELAQVAVERQREHQQAMIQIGHHEEQLNRVSLPIICVHKGVLVVPLIGELSKERAETLMERLLYSISKQETHIAIVDLTGLSNVNEQVASSLLETAKTIRLLGTTVLLAGITAQTAAALALHAFEKDLPPCYPNLAEALRRALVELGLSVSPKNARSWTR